MPLQPAASRSASLTVTSKGQVTLRKELLAGRSRHRATPQELQDAIETGWAGLPYGERNL